MHDLREWQLKELDTETVVRPRTGADHILLLHRPDCQTQPGADNPRIPSVLVEDLWLAETYRRNMLGESRIGFCDRCLTERK